jgi:hypothetical protein
LAIVPERRGSVGGASARRDAASMFTAMRDKRTIIGFRLIDRDFNKDRWLPSYRGVTNGSLKKDLISSLRRPQVMWKHHSSNCMGAELRENNAVLYPYEGIAFSICKQNNLVYRIDIPGNHN